jgi:hypothetical protein
MNNMVKYIVESRKLLRQLHGRFTAVLVCGLNIIALFGIFDITQVVGAYPLSSNWNFFDDLAHWKKTDWYITRDSQMDWQENPMDNVNQHGMGAGLIIGFPMVTTGKVVVDYVAYGNGKILEVAKSAQDISSHSKLFSTWGGLKYQALDSL